MSRARPQVMSPGELETLAEEADAIAAGHRADHSRLRPSDDRRQIRRLATMLAELARHLADQERDR